MNKQGIIRQYSSLMISGALTLLLIGGVLLVCAGGIVSLGYLLFYLTTVILHTEVMTIFHAVLVVLAIGCTAGLGIPILLLARNIQKSTESFSLLQFEDEGDEEGEYDEDAEEELDDGEELNEFLKKLHKTRNIGPIIPSPKTMDDLCPCGSGLKYKDCCGKFWL